MLILFPTLNELKGSLGDVALKEWKYGINEGVWRGCKVFVIGVTKTNAAFASALIFSELKPEKAMLAGICGAYRQSGLKIGDTLSIVKDWFVDEALYSGSSISLLGEEGFPVCEGGFSAYEPISGLRAVSSNTVSLLGGTDELSNLYYEKTKAGTENMEGASVGFAASRLNINITQLRSVSNYCGNRANQEWNIKAAFKSLHTFFQRSF